MCRKIPAKKEFTHPVTGIPYPRERTTAGKNNYAQKIKQAYFFMHLPLCTFVAIT